MIPRIIHQISINGECYIADSINKSIQELRARNPGWTYRLYDEAAIITYIQQHYGARYLECFRKISPEYNAAKADFFRYLVIYNEGGVYFDLKSTCLRPLDQVIHEDDTIILAGWDDRPGSEYQGFSYHKELAMLPFGEYQQWHIMAEAHSPFIKAVIERVVANINQYNSWSFGVGRKAVLKTTGPIPYSLAIHENINHYPHRYIRYDKDLYLKYINVTDFRSISKNHYSRKFTPVIKPGPLGYLLALPVIAMTFSREFWGRGISFAIRRYQGLLK